MVKYHILDILVLMVVLSAKLDAQMTTTSAPTAAPTPGPTPGPTGGPTPGPTGGPTGGPTPAPTGGPTPAPTGGPTPAPTGGPTPAPTGGPTPAPTPGPTPAPTAGPTPPPGLFVVTISEPATNRETTYQVAGNTTVGQLKQYSAPYFGYTVPEMNLTYMSFIDLVDNTRLSQYGMTTGATITLTKRADTTAAPVVTTAPVVTQAPTTTTTTTQPSFTRSPLGILAPGGPGSFTITVTEPQTGRSTTYQFNGSLLVDQLRRMTGQYFGYPPGQIRLQFGPYFALNNGNKIWQYGINKPSTVLLFHK
ncbi:mucin-2-like [Oppia nitens]|uniref:mucin-2-like n=1 Tax=Oppia nitens TaxID=1686743 RepID=UPI0023DC1037|nr:mucin-2-like [Oppia nitens]